MVSFEVRLERIRKLSPTTRDFRFRRTDDEIVVFQPGQFFRFTFQDEQGDFERSYSLCNFGRNISNSSEMDLVISVVEGGRASKLLFDCKEGLIARVAGAYGRLIIPKKMPQRLFLIATSVGIAPYMPMLTQLSNIIANGSVEVHFLYGTRDPSEFVYGEVLKQYAVSHSGFHLGVCYSRSTAHQFDHFEYHGYVQARLEHLSPDPATDHILLCGNPHMIDDTYALLKQQGFTARQVVREKYVFATTVKVKKKPVLTAAQKKLIQAKMKKFSSE